jgi:aminoglycoside phosphotransferase (APT) family kinase protein
VPTPWKRDLDAARASLSQWIAAQIPAARGFELSELTAPQSSGFSNETLLADARFERGGVPELLRLVIRIQPTGFQIFPEYDMRLQFRTMQLLAKTDVPVPPMYWIEEDDRAVLGAPFYVMGRVDGRVPSDNPPYNAAGWLSECSDAEVEAIWWGGLECLAKIARLDYRAAGFGFLERPQLGATPLDQHLAYYRKYHDWAARGKAQPTIDAAWQWLIANRPTGEPTGLVWGDARIGNILFDGTRPAAVLDWEMVTLGSPEVDLGWTLFLDRYHSEGVGVPRLRGFPSRAATVERFEVLSGHRVVQLHYHEVFAGYRFAVIMLRLAQQAAHYGAMDERALRALEIDNPITRCLAPLLGLPEPKTQLDAV